jgi:DNA-binding CsgD family transcriptional regulator
MSTLPSDELSRLLADLYAAPLNPQRWQPFFDQLCVLTECKLGIFLSVKEGQRNHIYAGGGVGYEPAPMALYNAHYGAFDPFSEPGVEKARVRLITGEELVPREDLVASEFYNDLLRPHDLEHLTVMPCLVRSDRLDVASFWRGAKQGPADPASLEILRQVMPHVQSALHLHHTFEALNERSILLETMLSHLPAAAFLLDRTGLVVSINPVGESILQSGNCIALSRGRLCLLDSAKNTRFEAILAKATGFGEVSCVPGAMTVSRGAEQELQLLALPFLREGTVESHSARVLVFLHDPSTRPRPRAELMKAIYALTPTEGRMADLLIEGHEIRQVANLMRITLETARFHLKRVMAKTGTRRQVELMRLMLLLPGC